MREAAAGDDVFAKITTMISNMVSKMEKSLAEDTNQAQQCEIDMKAAKEKLAAKSSEVSKYQNRIDKVVSKSAGLKSEVSELKDALSSLMDAKSKATKIRSKESALFKKNEPEIQQGLEGVKIALKALREYYGNQDQGAATGIVGMLEVVESDFAKQLAEMRVAESTAAEDFKKEEEDMKLERTRKEQDVQYKTEAHQRLDADLTDVQSDADSAQSVLDDAKEYAETVKSKCTVTPMSFEEKKAKRQQEIDDLKGALAALKSSSSSTAASLVQTGKASSLRQLRGVMQPM
jgi:chromosome segregation ATPase